MTELKHSFHVNRGSDFRPYQANWIHKQTKEPFQQILLKWIPSYIPEMK